MPLNFQFAFLGSGHNYFARVIRVSNNGLPQEGECITASYGLPKAFASKFDKKSYSKIFIFNIRGHDFLSHCGQWTSSKGKSGYVETSPTSISELTLLEPLRVENEKNGYDGSDMIISFGPQASSFFADVTAPTLKRYKSSNLPSGLDDEIQKNRDAKGYGNIYEVMMNAEDTAKKECGWVVLFSKGEKFAFGGALPPQLKEVLEEAKNGTPFRPKKNSIHRIYLNHQNPDEYVLLFNDGRCYASLHNDFREPLENVVSLWAKGNGLPNFVFKFISSCQCPKYTQKVQNASYYSRRGMFHLAKGNVDLALKYLREASDENESDRDIQDNLAMAIVAMHGSRPADGVLENRIKHRAIRARRPRPRRPEHQDEDTLFRDEYMWILDENYDIEDLRVKLEELRKTYLALVDNGKPIEWSYDKAVGGEVYEAGLPVHQFTKPEDELFELEGNELSHEMSAGKHSDTKGDGIQAKDANTGPNGLQKKSKFPFKLGSRLQKAWAQ